MNTRLLILTGVLMLSLSACTTTTRTTTYSEQWVQWYQQWRGTPYQYGGTGKRGIDCSALVQNAYQNIYGVNLPRTTTQQRRIGRQVSKRSPQVGDLLFFKPAGTPNHVGIYIGNNRFVHASSSKGVSIANLNRDYWLPRLIEVRRALN